MHNMMDSNMSNFLQILIAGGMGTVFLCISFLAFYVLPTALDRLEKHFNLEGEVIKL